MTTKAIQAYRNRVARLGCCVCRSLNYGETPAEIHHPRDGTGTALKSDERDIIPLCPNHHRHADGTARFHGEIAYHFAPEQWELRYGTQASFAEATRRQATWT